MRVKAGAAPSSGLEGDEVVRKAFPEEVVCKLGT